MELVEIRDLDGPNMFALEPTIKLEVSLASDETVGVARQQYIAEHTNHYASSDPAQSLVTAVAALHHLLKLPPVHPEIHRLDTPGNLSVCFPWDHRARGRAIARVAFELVAGERIEILSTRLAQAIEAETLEGEPDEPTWVRDSERRIPAAAITGTNGKTTTTRLLAHILGTAGKRVGWSSSSGVYIQGNKVIDGDYTGHGGARRVLTDESIDVGVLETARGGILLRGAGFESNDVGVFINVSSDHLDLHGIRTVETLARVKATVLRTTRRDGIAVLNADDPLVLAQKEDVTAPVMLTSQHPDNPAIKEHLRSGGRCLLLDHDEIVLVTENTRQHVVPIAEVPLTYGGIARHMAENALAACAAAIGLGLDLEVVAAGMRSFQPDRGHNAGRLNAFDLDDKTVIVDFAHNESGLQYLIEFARRFRSDAVRLTAVIGTAGDRQDSVFTALGRIAGTGADRVIVKYNERYLRGRTAEESIDLVLDGLRAVDATERLDGTYSSEFDAVIGAVDSAEPGEVIVAMCVQDYEAIMDELHKRGARERMPGGS